MEEPSARQTNSGGSDGNLESNLETNPAPPNAQNGGKQNSEGKAVAKHKAKRREISLRRIAKLYLVKGSKVGKDRWFELVLLAVVGFSAVAQLWTTIRNNRGTTQQTDQIIGAAKISAYAANQNANASRNFAENARGINQGVGDAVNRLQAQATATELARKTSVVSSKKALDAAIDNFHQDQRAWLGVCGFQMEEFKSGSPIRVSIKFCNSGKSPALRVEQRIGWQLTPKPIAGPTEWQDNLAAFGPTAAIPPQGSFTLFGGDYQVANYVPVTNLNVLNGSLDSLINSSQYLTYYGDLRYVDASGFPHTTQFCLYLADAKKQQLAYCKSHNELD